MVAMHMAQEDALQVSHDLPDTVFCIPKSPKKLSPGALTAIQKNVAMTGYLY